MTYQSSCPIFVIFVLSIFKFTVFCEESPEPNFLDVTTNSKQEYAHIFKSIPVLFEYLLVALQNNPEILESDDVMAFTDFTKRTIREIAKDNPDNDENKERKTKKDNSNNNAGHEDNFLVNFNAIARKNTQDEHNLLDEACKDSHCENIDQQFHEANDQTLLNQETGADSKDRSRAAEDQNKHITGIKELEKSKEVEKRTPDSRYFIPLEVDDGEGADQEAADVLDEVDNGDPVASDISDGDKGNDGNKDDEDEDGKGFRYTTTDVEQKILLTELMLEEYNE